MNKKQKLITKLVLIICISLIGCESNKVQDLQSERPNIIIILSDDMGYSDIAPYGGEINTPNLGVLAKDGLKFTQFYNAARCCPTRASLLTGNYPHEAGIGHMTNPPKDINGHNYGVSEYIGKLNSNVVTIPEVLKQAGYSTLMLSLIHI